MKTNEAEGTLEYKTLGGTLTYKDSTRFTEIEQKI